jgi:hypothetical protein
MAQEYSASVDNFVSTVVVDNWKGTGRRVRMNFADYNAAHGAIIEGPTQPEIAPGVSDPPLKDPKVDDEGRRIADQNSPMLRA